MVPSRILVVRLGAMGDVIHALPAVTTLRRNFPSARITWVIDPKWLPLLEGNPDIDESVPFDRRSWTSLRSLWTHLRRSRFDLAIDFQGLIKSALIVAASRAKRRVGFSREQLREPASSLFYTQTARPTSTHVVDRNLELAQACGATHLHREFPLPPGSPEGDLPSHPYILACPLAGWASKQWPVEYYANTAQALRDDGCALVVNGPPNAREALSRIAGAHVHISGIRGLIDATRRAAGVIGVDSGPLHLAAALGKPGVAVFGPTDPARNGPYGPTITTLRDPHAATTYKRDTEVAASMRTISPDAVVEALRARLAFHTVRSQP